MTSCPWPLPLALASELMRQARSAATHYGPSLSAHDRLDIAQASLLALLASLRSGVRIENPAAWLMRTARNQCALLWRRMRREAGAVSLSLAVPTLDDDSAESFDLLSRSDEWSALEDLLASVQGLCDEEKDELRDVAAGGSRSVTAWTKEKVRKAQILTRGKQRYRWRRT